MSEAWLLVKDNMFTHCYSSNIKEKHIQNGWICVGSVTGWNMGFCYSNEKVSIPQQRANLKNKLRELDKRQKNE